MNLGELITLARIKLRDTQQPYHWNDVELTEYFNEAEREAAIRARPLVDDTSFQIELVPEQVAYQLDHRIIDVLEAKLDDEAVEFELSETELTLDCAPEQAGTLILKASRLPLINMINLEDEPEIREVHRVHLIDWALSRAHLVADPETFNPQISEFFEKSFERYFGTRHYADTLRKHRRKSPRVIAYGGY